MRILITGSTGFIGSHLIRRLLDDGFQITACARSPENYGQMTPSINWIKCDFTQDINKGDWLPRLKDIDLVINAVGIISQKGEQSFHNVQTNSPIALFDACEEKQVKVIQISALGADHEDQPEFLSSKRQADQHLQSLSIESIILYPSIIIGRGGQSSELFNAVSAFIFTPLIGDGGQKIQAIHINDVTAIISHMISNWSKGKHTHQLVGAKILTNKELYSILRNWLKLGKPNFLEMPMPFIRLAAKMGDITKVGMLNSDTLHLMENAETPNSTYSGYRCKDLEESLTLEPAEKADIWLARTLFIRPLILWSLIFIWIFTGITSVFLDLESGYELMAAGGVYGTLATLTIYGGALFDFCLGVAMMMNYRMRFVLSTQITLMLGYMIGIVFIVPEQWLHPFGPVTKNFVLLAATLYLFMTEPRRTKT